MLKIEMLSAAHGDAILVEYGRGKRRHRILIDAGPISSYQAVFDHIKGATNESKGIELFVISHIDTDHIDGGVVLLRDTALNINFGDIWFNAWPQLATEAVGDTYGPQQGEFLSALINLQKRKWNYAFEGRAVVVPDTGPLPVTQLADGAKITLVSPGDRQLRRLRRNWDSVISDAGWNPGNVKEALSRLEERREYQPAARRDTFADAGFGTDNAVANGSSIAFVMDYDGTRCLFAADALADVLAGGLRRYAAQNNIAGRIPFDAVKLPHHGSMKNWSSDLHKLLTSKNFLISTSGAKFRHPDHETIDLILKEEPEKNIQLWFNYDSETTSPWKSPTGARYKSRYPAAPGSPTVVTLSSGTGDA